MKNNIIEQEKKYILQTYRRHALVLKKAQGQYVWDIHGKKYLDFFAGISVSNIGHAHPRVVAAIRKQAAQLVHVSNLYYTEPPVRLAELLITRSFPGKVFFSNSGAEANECALKAARKWGNGRHEVITFLNSFHGRTLGTLAATGQKKFHTGFTPLTPGFTFAAYNDLASVKKCITAKTAAVMVEPVQGEGGVIPADRAFLQGLRKLCDQHNLLLIIDEIQTGMGRTGTFFAYEHFGITPDIVTLAKSLAGGLPLGATIIGTKAEGCLGFGEHGSTFGGNPVACAAAIAAVGVITPRFLKQVVVAGDYFRARLQGLRQQYPSIRDVRGSGLLVGLPLDFPGKEIVQFCQEKGLLINCTQDTVLRFLPPLIVTRRDIDTAIHILEEAFSWHQSKK